MRLGRRLRVSLFLERRAPREAGFTEQRQPSALGSGRTASLVPPGTA
uniref:Uncharacterized protein n=1 Tax=Rhizophora mucronata TaxID=61149 RepID=A0A2P2Q757_RHIMU